MVKQDVQAGTRVKAVKLAGDWDTTPQGFYMPSIGEEGTVQPTAGRLFVRVRFDGDDAFDENGPSLMECWELEAI